MPLTRHTAGLSGRARGDEGFVLLESIVSITLITVIMAALTSLFVTVIRVNNEQRARQVAIQVADSTASYVRSLPTSDLLTGHTSAAVDAQWSAAPVGVAPYLAAMEKAVATGTPVLPLTLDPQVVRGISYTVNVYLGWCHTTSVAPSTGSSGSSGSSACVTPTAAAAIHDQLRAVIGVSWQDQRCGPLNASDPTRTCTYVGATLISTLADPVFTLNQPAASLPVITVPPLSGFAVGDTVDLQMGVEPGTGVPVLTWLTTSGSWPAGVSMDTAGRITGTLTAAPSASLTVSVTDGFARTVSTSFTWTVLPQLVATSPGDQNGPLAAAIDSLSLAATGGTGPTYTWAVDPSGPLPPGLTLSAAGVVSGTPSGAAPKPYGVVLSVTDQGSRHTAKVSFTWTIRTPLTLSNVGDRTGSVGQPAVSYTPGVTGGKGPYTWTSTSLPPGLSMATNGLVTGTPSTVGARTVTVTATDQWGIRGSATFTWTVNAAPTVTSPGNLTSGGGSPVKIRVASTCATTPCSYALSGGPPGVTIDATGLMTGTLGAGAATYSGVTVKVTDAAGATATASFTWGVTTADFANTTWPVSTSRGGTPEQPWSYNCPAAAGSSCQIVVSGLPPGIGIGRTSGAVARNTTTTLTVGAGSGVFYLNGTVDSAAALQAYTVSVKGSLVADPTYNRTFTGTWTVQ